MFITYSDCDWSVVFALQTLFQVTIILGMTDYYMHMGSFGSSNITLWDVLWATFHMLAGLQLS
ncbi:Peptidase S24/S26A/S26B/S26C family protein [Zea mays]|uniref:Peptidase S24/S26A/S26B/S26C family protein n=1 Tax=Zea mays TaxID=4577 RepID=A0A1D6FMG3_MAIZE|nr:Peptidase S24/S26A/S26B/S26C family protein [Zea mays]